MHEALGRSFVRTSGLLSRASAARATHALQMFTARVASEPAGTKCATSRKSCAPNLFHVHNPADPTRTPECNGDLRGGNSGA
eukprot:7048749-Prymnesium_polylepis.4